MRDQSTLWYVASDNAIWRFLCDVHKISLFTGNILISEQQTVWNRTEVVLHVDYATVCIQCCISNKWILGSFFLSFQQELQVRSICSRWILVTFTEQVYGIFALLKTILNYPQYWRLEIWVYCENKAREQVESGEIVQIIIVNRRRRFRYRRRHERRFVYCFCIPIWP